MMIMITLKLLIIKRLSLQPLGKKVNRLKVHKILLIVNSLSRKFYRIKNINESNILIE